MSIHWPDPYLPPINLWNAPRQGKRMTVLNFWYEAYVENRWDDPHQAFADCCGISRQEAKVKAYEIAYRIHSSKIMEGYKDE